MKKERKNFKKKMNLKRKNLKLSLRITKKE